MTKMKSKKITRSTLAVIIMAIAMVALLAFGGTYAYFTAQVNTMGTTSFKTGKVSLKAKEALTIVADGAVVVPGDKIIDKAVTYTNESTVPTYVAVVVTMTVAGKPVTDKDAVDDIISLAVTGTWDAIVEGNNIVYVYKNAEAIDAAHDEYAVAAAAASGTDLAFCSAVDFAADEHRVDGAEITDSLQDKTITLKITAYQTQTRMNNATLKLENATAVWTSMKTMLGADYKA